MPNIGGIGVIAAALLSPFLIGGAVSLTALIPPLRRAARSSPGIRAIHQALGMLLAFVLMFIVVAAAAVEVGMGVALFYLRYDEPEWFVDPGSGSAALTAEAQPRVDAARFELLLRQINPLPGPACYTTVDACAWADRIAGTNQSEAAPGAKAISMGVVLPAIAGLISALVAGALIRRLTRPPKPGPAGVDTSPPVEPSSHMA